MSCSGANKVCKPNTALYRIWDVMYSSITSWCFVYVCLQSLKYGIINCKLAVDSSSHSYHLCAEWHHKQNIWSVNASSRNVCSRIDHPASYVLPFSSTHFATFITSGTSDASDKFGHCQLQCDLATTWECYGIWVIWSRNHTLPSPSGEFTLILSSQKIRYNRHSEK